MVRNKKQQEFDAALAAGQPIDLNSLAALPELLERYYQHQQELIAQRLERGEEVDMEELAQYPALLMANGGYAYPLPA